MPPRLTRNDTTGYDGWKGESEKRSGRKEKGQRHSAVFVMGNGPRRVDESRPPSLTRYRPGNSTALCVEVPWPKSTFVTAPSFASSSSVTSINHVPRLLHPRHPLSKPSLSTRFPAYTHEPVLSRRPPLFFHPVPISLLSVSPFFFLVRSYTCHPRARTLSRKCIHRAEMKFCEPRIYVTYATFRAL